MEAMIGGLPARLCMGTALTLALCSDLGHFQPSTQPTTSALHSRRRRCRWADGEKWGMGRGSNSRREASSGSTLVSSAAGPFLRAPVAPFPPLSPREELSWRDLALL